MIELITVVALIILIRFLINPREKSSAVEKGNNAGKQHPGSIVGKSRFVLGSEKEKQAEITEQDSDYSGKLDIEVSLDYVAEDTDLLEEHKELEELERHGLQSGYSSNITFDEMMEVVNELENENPHNNTKTGKLLYENENTDWVEQLSTSTDKSAKRIAGLIDLHLGRLAQANSNLKLDDGFSGFDIREYI